MKHIKRKFSAQKEVPGLTKTLDDDAKGHPSVDTFPTKIPDGMKGIIFTDQKTPHMTKVALFIKLEAKPGKNRK